MDTDPELTPADDLEPSSPPSPPGPRPPSWYCPACCDQFHDTPSLPPGPGARCDECLRTLSVREQAAVVVALREREPTASADVPRRRAYTVQETGVLLGVSVTKVKDLLRDGKLAAVQAGKRRRIMDSEITRYLTTNGHGRRGRSA